VMNIMYDVGARDEDPERTGFAHLFEHLMFGGSINIPTYDSPLQMAGGENNAYTSNDITNYYIQLPAENLETAFWLESDRMLSLAFGEKSLDVQRKVVCEEFKEHYLNKPYGDVWHKMRDLAYKVHPYRWMTIGKFYNKKFVKIGQLRQKEILKYTSYFESMLLILKLNSISLPSRVTIILTFSPAVCRAVLYCCMFASSKLLMPTNTSPS